MVADYLERKAMASWNTNNRQVAVSYAGKAASGDHSFIEYDFQEAKMRLSLALSGSDPELYVDARRRLSALSRRNPDAEEVQMMYALCLLKEFEARQYVKPVNNLPLMKKAEEIYRKIVANDPNNADAQFKLARCEMYGNRFEAAISRAMKASKLSPYLPEPWDIAGSCYLWLGDKPASDRAFAKAHEVLEQGAKSK